MRSESEDVPEDVPGSYTELEKFVGDVVKKLGDEEDVKVEEEVEEQPFWSVKSTEEIGYCLLASGQIRLELVEKGERNKTIQVDIPVNAEITGVCKPGSAELRFEWKDERIGKEKNLLNLVMENHHANLAHLHGAFLRLKTKHGREEFYSSMETGSYTTLLWPIRYQVRCQRTLSYDMAPASEEIRKYKEVVLQLIDLRIEAFRDITLRGHRPKSLSPQWYRREWGCEFHRTFHWAPYVVAGGLATMLLVIVVAFILRNSAAKKPKTKYERL